MLSVVREFVPMLLPFVHSAYATTSSLFWGDKVLESAEGVQQGDPLGPLLFCLTIYQLTPQLKADFCVFYLDDGSLGGNLESVIRDLRLLESAAEKLGLKLNKAKSEVICKNPTTLDEFLSAAPGFRVTSPEQATLLGSPLGDCIDCIDDCISSKVSFLKIMENRLQHLQSHDALLLLRHSLAIPRLIYLLRTTPCFLSSQLSVFDEVLRRMLSSVTNICFSSDDNLWLQASLPVRYGLGGTMSYPN